MALQKNKLAARVADVVVGLARSVEQDLRPRARKEQNLGYRLLRAALQHATVGDRSVKMQVVHFAAKVLEAFKGVQVEESYAVFVRDNLAHMLQHGTVDVRAAAARTFALLPSIDDDEMLEVLGNSLSDSSTDVRLEVLSALEQMGGWRKLASVVAERVHDVDEGVRLQAFATLSIDQAKAWLDHEMLLDVALSGVRDPEESVRSACVKLLMQVWRGADIEVELSTLTEERGMQDLLMRALVSGDLRLSIKYFRDKIDCLTPVAARLWMLYLETTPHDMREGMLPSVAAYVAALDYYSAQPDQFVTFCSMLPCYDMACYEAQRDKVSELLRKVLLQLDASDSLFSVDILEAAQVALKVLHPEPRDWLQVCLEIVLDLIDDDVHGPDGVRWVPALHVAHGVLQDPRVSVAMPGVLELHSVMLKGMASLDPAARVLAVRAFGCYCLSSLEMAKNFMLIFCVILNKDLVEVQVEASKVILDFCLVFGASLVPSVSPQVLEELRNGPHCQDEPHPVLARVLAPLDVRDSDHALQDVACVGLAKLLQHDRLHSYTMLGRAVAKAAEGVAVMERFVEDYAQRLPKVCLPRLRRALRTAVMRLRGKYQGAALRELARNWNVPWDSLAAEGLRRGGDVMALHCFCPSGGPATDALREALLLRASTEKSSAVLGVLREWAFDRKVELPGMEGVRKKKTPASKKSKTSIRKRGEKQEAVVDSNEEDDFVSPMPTKRAALAKHLATMAPSPEMQALRKYHDQLDAFQLPEEEPVSTVKRERNVQVPETAVKRPRPDPLVLDLTDVEAAAEAARSKAEADRENERVREKLAKLSVEKRGRETSSSHDTVFAKRLKDSEETPLRRGAEVHVVCSGLDAAGRKQIKEVVDALGGRVLETTAFTQKTTHVVVASLRNNHASKVLAAALKGCWIVSLDWIAESSRRNTFVDEAVFGTRFSRSSRPVFCKSVFIAPDFVQAQKTDEVQPEHVEALLFTPFLGGAKRSISVENADVILTARKEGVKAKLGQRVLTWSELRDAIVTQ